jgi:hypothetical protein
VLRATLLRRSPWSSSGSARLIPGVRQLARESRSLGIRSAGVPGSNQRASRTGETVSHQQRQDLGGTRTRARVHELARTERRGVTGAKAAPNRDRYSRPSRMQAHGSAVWLVATAGRPVSHNAPRHLTAELPSNAGCGPRDRACGRAHQRGRPELDFRAASAEARLSDDERSGRAFEPDGVVPSRSAGVEAHTGSKSALGPPPSFTSA